MVPRPGRLLVIAVVAAAATLNAAACRRVEGPAAVDLLAELGKAERRAGGDVATAVTQNVVTIGGDARPALVAMAPARITWTTALPEHARLETALAQATDVPGATVRIGLAADRAFDEVLNIETTREWTPQVIDLRRFSEVKLSLFYQPRSLTWRVVVNVGGPAGAGVALARPVLVSATKS